MNDDVRNTGLTPRVGGVVGALDAAVVVQATIVSDLGHERLPISGC
jgi:hypothetical protein